MLELGELDLELAVAAAGAGLAAIVDEPVRAASAVPDNRPRLPARILTRATLPNAMIAQIRAISPQIALLSPDRFADELPSADVVFGKLSPEQVASAKQLRWLQVTSVGVDTVLTPEFVSRNLILTNPHAPAAARGSIPERNMDAWYAAFAVKPGDKAFIPEDQRVRIW